MEGSTPALSRPKWPQRSASLGLEMVIRQDFGGFKSRSCGEVSNDNEATVAMVTVDNICSSTYTFNASYFGKTKPQKYKDISQMN